MMDLQGCTNDHFSQRIECLMHSSGLCKRRSNSAIFAISVLTVRLYDLGTLERAITSS